MQARSTKGERGCEKRERERERERLSTHTNITYICSGSCAIKQKPNANNRGKSERPCSRLSLGELFLSGVSRAPTDPGPADFTGCADT